MKVLDLFSGIGGFSLGLGRAGMQTVAFCEIDPFCRKVLRKHWPDVPIYGDVRELTKEKLEADGITANLICGGYPCQPFSKAGKRNGEKDDRHLWPEMHRIISAVHPRWVLAENVAGHISMGLDRVLSDLEGSGYAWWAFVIPACAVDARHRRDRVWIIANADGAGFQKRFMRGGIQGEKGHTGNWKAPAVGAWWTTEPSVVRRLHGIPQRVDRIRSLGNAVVPQIPEIIGRAIMECSQ